MIAAVSALNPRPVRAVMFDLDGTLIDTLPQLTLAAAQTAGAMGLTVPERAAIRNFVGGGITLLLARVIAGRRDVTAADVDAELLARSRARFNLFYASGLKENFAVYPEVTATLRACRQELGLKLAVVTNKPQTFTEPLLGYAGLRDEFDYVLGGEVLSIRKPDPGVVRHAATALGLEPAACVMVGDSDNDIVGGRLAGAATVFVRGGYFSGDEAALGADLTVDSIGQVLPWLRSRTADADAPAGGVA